MHRIGAKVTWTLSGVAARTSKWRTRDEVTRCGHSDDFFFFHSHASFIFCHSSEHTPRETRWSLFTCTVRSETKTRWRRLPYLNLKITQWKISYTSWTTKEVRWKVFEFYPISFRSVISTSLSIKFSIQKQIVQATYRCDDWNELYGGGSLL
jgi:hypothetical protein